MHNFSLDIYAEKIFYYKKAFLSPNNLLKSINDNDHICSNDQVFPKWSKWESSDGNYQFGETKRSMPEKYKNSHKNIKNIYDEITNTFNILSINYSSRNYIEMGPMSPISISRYDEGKSMGPHDDARSGALISAVAYLNDDYVGGELNFPSHKVSIKPEAGSVIFFPSSGGFIHDPKPAYGSQRYIIPAFWINFG